MGNHSLKNKAFGVVCRGLYTNFYCDKGKHCQKRNKHSELSVYQTAASNEAIGSVRLSAYYGCVSRDIISFNQVLSLKEEAFF